jgi:hypothetical protein
MSESRHLHDDAEGFASATPQREEKILILASIRGNIGPMILYESKVSRSSRERIPIWKNGTKLLDIIDT